MRIAQVAPLFESVPPRYYGGTERVVSWLTEELVRMGHEVTLFASGDSDTAAELVSSTDEALRLGKGWADPLAPHLLLMERVAQRSHRFDIVHFHTDYVQLPFARRFSTPALTTLHGRLDIPDLVPLFREFSEAQVVAVSNAQRMQLPWLNWVATVHHGLPVDRFRPRAEPGAYLAFLGRISPEKGVDRAVAIARAAGMPLKVAAKIDDADRAFFESEVAQLFTDPLVEFVGEITEVEKGEFLGEARALLFPIDWPEPFGLVMIEAMACGTPSIAFPAGSVGEVIEDGITGFIVEDVDAAVRAVGRMGDLSRSAVRRGFDDRFSAERMARGYVSAYEAVVASAQERQMEWAPIGPGVADSLVTTPAPEGVSVHEPATAGEQEGRSGSV